MDALLPYLVHAHSSTFSVPPPFSSLSFNSLSEAAFKGMLANAFKSNGAGSGNTLTSAPPEVTTAGALISSPLDQQAQAQRLHSKLPGWKNRQNAPQAGALVQIGSEQHAVPR